MEQFLKEALDFLANGAIGFSLGISIITLLIFAVLVVIQTIEWATRRDYLSKYRGIILAFLVVSFLAMIPVTYFLFLRSTGFEAEDIRNLATVAGRLGVLAQALSLVFIFFYRGKE